MLEKYMEQFEEEMEQSLKGPAGTYLIPLDDGINIVISKVPNGFSLFSEVIECPKENEEEIYYQSLMANLFGQGTNGSILGLNDRGNLLTLSRVVDYNVEYKDFKEILEDFINSVDFWKDEVYNRRRTGM